MTPALAACGFGGLLQIPAQNSVVCLLGCWLVICKFQHLFPFHMLPKRLFFIGFKALCDYPKSNLIFGWLLPWLSSLFSLFFTINWNRVLGYAAELVPFSLYQQFCHMRIFSVAFLYSSHTCICLPQVTPILL